MTSKIPQHLSPEHQLILNCARIKMEDEIHSSSLALIKSGLNWEYVFKTAESHKVAPLMYPNLKKLNETHEIPPSIMAQFRKSYHITWVRNTKMYNELAILLSVFEEQKIQVLLTKGAALAVSVYKNIGLRPMSDIDIIIKKEDAQTVKEILLKNCYKENKPYPRNFFFKIVDGFPTFVNGHVSIDIKWNIRYYNNVKYDFDLFKNTTLFKSNDILISSLSPEDQIVLSFYHILKHKSQNEEQLLWYCDLAEMINEFGNTLKWENIPNRLISLNDNNVFFKLIYDLQKYFNIDLSSQHMDITSHGLMFNPQDLFEAGGACKKSINRQAEIMYKMNTVDTIKGKVLYVIGCLFPSNIFLSQRYNVKNHLFIYLLFIFRPFILVYELASNIAVRLINSIFRSFK